MLMPYEIHCGDLRKVLFIYTCRFQRTIDEFSPVFRGNLGLCEVVRCSSSNTRYFCKPKAGSPVTKFGGTERWNPELLKWVQDEWHKTWLEQQPEPYLKKAEKEEQAGVGVAGDKGSRTEGSPPAPAAVVEGGEKKEGSTGNVQSAGVSSGPPEVLSAPGGATTGDEMVEAPATVRARSSFVHVQEQNETPPPPPKNPSVASSPSSVALASLAELRDYAPSSSASTVTYKHKRNSFFQRRTYELERYDFVKKRERKLERLGLHPNHRGPETSFLALSGAVDLDEDPTGADAAQKAADSKLDAGELAEKGINNNLNTGQVAGGISPNAECAHDTIIGSSLKVIANQVKAMSGYL